MRKTTLLLCLAVIAIGSSGSLHAVAAGPASGDFAEAVEIDGGRKLYLECRGAGSPTVILEAGLRNRADIWSVQPHQGEAVLPAVAGFTRVCAYDRPGTTLGADQLSRSDPVPMPRTPRAPSPICTPCSKPRPFPDPTSWSDTRRAA